jgi:hypothetical protein
MTENTVFIIILIIIVILACVQFRKHRNESFTDMHNWGNSDQDYATFNANTIVGPDPSSNDTCNWQYNPRSTLVNYNYYNNNNDLEYYQQKNNMNTSSITDNRKTLQLAPISNSQNGNNLYSNCIQDNNVNYS